MFGLIGAMGPYGFLVLAATAVTSLLPQLANLVLIAPLAAGFLIPRRGIMLGGLACLLAEILALLGGRASIGLLKIGTQTTPLVSLRSTPVSSLLDFTWLNARPFVLALLLKLFTPFFERPFLLAQVILWAIAAGVMGALLPRLQPRGMPTRLMAVGSGALVLGIGHSVLPVLLAGDSVESSTIVFGVLVPTVLAMLASPVLETASLVLSLSSLGQTQPRGLIARREIPSDTWDELAGLDNIKPIVRSFFRAVSQIRNPHMC